jgi:hypothetical protein
VGAPPAECVQSLQRIEVTFGLLGKAFVFRHIICKVLILDEKEPVLWRLDFEAFFNCSCLKGKTRHSDVVHL